MSAHGEWLSTSRLSLRPPTPADAPAVLRILSNRAVARHHPSELVLELAEVDALLQRWLDHWSRHGFGNCCVFEEETGDLVGNCGVRRSTARGTPVLNLMYRFHPSVWGRGYATEAASAVVGWTSDNLPGQVVLARIRPVNLASRRVAGRIGLRRDPGLDDLGEDGPEWAFTNRPGHG